MKIKNIKEYRKFYKEEVRDQPTRDENFIGNFRMENGKKKFGWFDIYHGDKEGYGKAENGIENFLQSFLDMARDGQAVYEFLQNAVDAGSSHYTMVWGQDKTDGNYYLMVANNGDMFSLNSVRSILNVGSSTKTADSKTIGKFGIGFKLAHRLVGKDNGLEELLHENSGPLLYSWQNYDIAQLAAGSEPEPTSMEITSIGENQYRSDDPAPWLFKILITCFPNLPENESVLDLPTMANGTISPAPPFSQAEYQTLSRWVNKYTHILNKETYQTGSLFFIKLGEGKENELAEGNLQEGVKFALAILNQTADEAERSKNVLRTVQLNNAEPITLPELEYLRIDIDKENQADTYAFIRFGVNEFADLSTEQLNKVAQESDIEVLFGFRPYDRIDKYFRGAPNFYLYFPLSEEVHNFNYILHSNAFYKGSSRTFLHKGSGKDDGINERLLKVIVDKIEEEFIRLTESALRADRRKFLDFYAALLSSGHSANNERKWIEEPYVNRVTKLLKRFVPCRQDLLSDDFLISNDPAKVFIKDTGVDIDINGWGLSGVNWFYWGEGSDLQLKLQANIKLDIKKYGLQELLKAPASIVVHLNDWIGSDPDKMSIIMREALVEHSLFNDVQRANLFELKLFLFQKDEVHSIESFKEVDPQGYLISRNKLTEIRDILSKLDLRHSINDVEEFTKAYHSYFGTTSQLGNYDILTRRFSDHANDEQLGRLPDNEKLRVYHAFRTFNDSPGTRMPLLKIFANKKGDYHPIGQLIEETSKRWLAPYKVEKDFGTITKTYLVKEEKDIYEAIIKPFWGEIADKMSSDSVKSNQILTEIIDLFAQSEWADKNKNLIDQQLGIFFKGEFIQDGLVFFDIALKDISAKNYSHIQQVLFSLFDTILPDQFFLKHLQSHPFDFKSIGFIFDVMEGEIDGEDLNALLLLDKTIDGDFFETHAIGTQDGKFIIFKNQAQIYTLNKKLLKYIDTHLRGEFILIPEELDRFKDRAKLTHAELIDTIIRRFEENDIAQELELIEAILEEGLSDQLKLFKGLTYLDLDATWDQIIQNGIYLRLANNLLSAEDEDFDLSEIHAKLRLIRESGDIIIGNIHNAEDNILIPFQERTLHISQSQLLDLEDKEGISVIEEFARLAVQQGFLTAPSAERLFKQNSTSVSEELVTLFIDKINDGQLKNSHQLIFLLFSGNFDKSEFENYHILTESGDLYPVDGNIVLHSPQNTGFINEIFHLDESFQDLQSVLGISDLEVIQYGEEEEDILLPKFLFLPEVEVDILESNTEQLAMLDYLFISWPLLTSQFKTRKLSDAWTTILGFDPRKKLIGKLILEEEQLDKKILDWMANDTFKMSFLSAIGVSLEVSEILKLRQWLCNEPFQESISKDLAIYQEHLLFNTVKGLANRYGNLLGRTITFEKDSAKLDFIEEIYECYNNQDNYLTIPDLVHVSSDTFRIAQSDEKETVHIEQEVLDLLFKDDENRLDFLFDQELVVKESMANLFTYEDLELDEEFILPNVAIEHDEPFYLNWKINYQIRLFKVEEIIFNVFYQDQSIGAIKRGDFYLDKTSKDFKDIYYRKSLSLENLCEKLEDSELAQPLKEMIEDKDSMLRNLYNVMNAAGKDEISDANLRALRIAMMQENIIHQRSSYAENMLIERKYSYNWFTTFLNYLATFESQQKNIQQKTIVFQEISHYTVNGTLSDKFFLLKAANSLIPVNIEEFAEFALELTFKDKTREKIMVEGVSKKGQDLLIYCRKPLSNNTLIRLPEVLNLKISFTPKLDLFRELKLAFENVNNIEEWEEIEEALPALHYIYGPPGTGKTTTICSQIADAVRENHSLRVLLLTPTNKAADVVAKKLIKDHSDVSVIRVGKATDGELEQEQIYQDSLSNIDVDSTHVIASTVHRIPYFRVDNEDTGIDPKLFELKGHWDYVVFDESSMISLPYMVFCIQAISRRCPGVKIIIAGDPQQIPPVSALSDADLEALDIDEENIYKMMGVNSFVDSAIQVRELDTMQQLSTQYRSLPQIGQLFSELAYGSELKHHRGNNNEQPRLLPERFRTIINQAVSFVNIPLDEQNSILSIGKLFYSAYHLHSAIFIAEAVKYLDGCLIEGESWTIGLIAPYKAQAALMNRIITSYHLSDRIKISCDTVHGFQGDECDMVFFVANPSQTWYTGHKRSLLSKKYIYNVAISRARDYLIVLHPYKKITGNVFINDIKGSYENNFGPNAIIDYRKIEKIIFGDENFIERNSYLTGHDSINVFGQNEIKYFIKSSDQAIDIVLKP
ncbi:AAA domain-containing protein [Pedobacter sp. MC2016-05]|uniref:AAA domain-containing protein n=1 Tax=Pedobacter sp. MC2016-05 TaxID=2994474 RepID=UPI0022464A5A|nr:AAA domain-containing protein [Pedobacter sp. MC2016-05]MCX2472761.1 AAA domain-containing protein [Pedobacter sp. MC2016-05]